ncbi:hypothetical protein JOF41_007306 [Saccharothrix coeruleofusca]|uniref:hypothetical protein n=1 Tax=Saccharothrix coeruleofusca TaxID=33919 RepID=UPI001AE82974|nr:hypothetical protein [Saccharothrix coeruleofusca]MBP2341052.1 hypothetical protein [Saccharothrix coeruleofusca]
MRWYPDGTRSSYSPPEVGDLVAWNHAAWRVVEVNPVPEDMWTDEEHRNVRLYKPTAGTRVLPVRVVLRPAHLGDDVRTRHRDKHIRHRHGMEWFVFPTEHYPICARCHEPLPCREQLAAREAEAVIKRMNRYTMPGVCPSCEQPVTIRTKVRTFDENLEMPGGPPVTFHVGRSNCRWDAAAYEKRWVAQDPTNRRTELSCPGTVTRHNDRSYECTEGRGCRGPVAFHRAYQSCGDKSCCQGVFDCHPWPDDALREVTE